MRRLDELLADRALVGLDEAEERELQHLMREPFEQPTDLELVAAALNLALGPSLSEPLPNALRRRLVAEADTFAAVVGAARTEFRSAPPIRDRSRAAQWVAAAASLLALIGWWVALSSDGSRDAPADRAELLARQSVVRAEWTGTDLAPDVKGDVIWSQDSQTGYMRFEGLPVNDPSAEQYQLWIFDSEQQHPIDGGVFDITSMGEVLVPIDAKLRVAAPTLFAVTLEKPGGVVVSDRERIAVLGEV